MEGKEPSELYALTVSEHLKLVKPVLWAHTLISKGRCPRWLTLNIYVIYIFVILGSLVLVLRILKLFLDSEYFYKMSSVHCKVCGTTYQHKVCISVH